MGPFVKWAGGKSQLVERLWERTPNTYDRYFEPFIGGGALLLHLRPTNAVINDTNEQLINVYRQLQNDASAVIRKINALDEGGCNKEIYLKRREEYNKIISNNQLDAECAAYMIWINKHCFNGLYRVNRRGLFNVPYNNKQTGKSMDEANLTNIGYYLSHNDIEIRCTDFAEVCQEVRATDFVYFDSPYVPISITADFTDYTIDGFHDRDHIRLSELFRMLDAQGTRVMLSNNDVPLVRELYDGYTIERVDVRRAINSDATRRTGTEVIIRNYD